MSSHAKFEGYRPISQQYDTIHFMARPIEFSPEDARARIADVFSAHGYNGTSLSMLMDATGLGKQSLYNAFGDKKQMYLNAVDCAAETFAVVVPKMNSAPNGMAALEVFFDYLIDCCISDSPALSNCIVCNGLLNNAEELDMQSRHAERWTASHAALKKTIERGVKDGSIADVVAAANAADLLMSLVGGLRVNARALVNTSQSAKAVSDNDTRETTNNSKITRARLKKSVTLGLSLFKPGARL
jgi:TetR/AcrR family transcriptional regulator, transcriptional repressor for nem operon